ncbi:hypothetical protein NHX12_007403 [Muraenolepis orangiensis]|uniref:Ig-like domain-containing protein n=1 Tax=Muraenolepis orangiensis TaxID=630683 RepID=A0A9Q0DP25_9TELE|nr:hypothetical protein NHX12_007403 [Muraenolepis orangiensis]
MRSSAMLGLLIALLLGLFHIRCGEAQVLTEVPLGPLYRVVGHPLLIPCNVSGFKDAETTKEFEFRMQRPGKPMDINVISTEDPNFSFSAFSGRVENNEIHLEHVAPNSVHFQVSKLLPSDVGEYECAVINKEQNYNGVYAAKITVKVIDNTLTVSSPDSGSARLAGEGDPLALTCQASSNTVQHTHLSVTWYLHKEGEPDAHPLVSLDRDLTLTPGPRFQERFRAGAVRLDKVGEAMYRLNIARLAPSDQGQIYCRAQEWIQDPDRSWFSITQKDTEPTRLTVKAKDEAVADPRSLGVRISVQQETLQEGQQLVLTCSVDNPAPGQLLSMAWLRGGSELARFGPTGVLQVGAQYSGRELTATKTGDGVHLLVLRPVRVQDQGGYLCRAWHQDRGPDGDFTQGVAHDSATQMVNISATEGSGLSVEMESNGVAATEGDKLQLTCKATGGRGQLSVAWDHKLGSPAASTGSFTRVVSLSHEGVIQAGADFAQRSVRATRPAANTFALELDGVVPSDAGTYRCTVTEWSVGPSGDASETHSQSQMSNVQVLLLDTLFQLKLMSRNTQATVGDQVELICRLRGPEVLPPTLRWTLRRNGSASPDTVLTLSPGGAVAWQGGWQRRYQLSVERLQEGEILHKLMIAGASTWEEGRYGCEASVFLDGRHKKVASSNELAVKVTIPESKLSLSSMPSLSVDAGADVTLNCFALATTPGASHFAVTWHQGENNRTVLWSDRDGRTVSHSRGGDDQRRISALRMPGLGPPRFELTVRQAQVGDGGRYSCMVMEWLQDPDGNWFVLPPARTTTELHVLEPANNLHIAEEERHLVVTEGEDVDLNCSLTSGASDASLSYSLSWLYAGPDPSAVNRSFTLAELGHGGLLRRPENPELQGSSLGRRLFLSRPTHGSFRLGIQRTQQGDGGAYWCRVEQFQLEQPGRWQLKAVDNSGRITLTVKATESKLSMGIGGDVNLTVTPSQSFVLPCSVAARTSPTSAFGVTWFWQKETGAADKRVVFEASADGTLRRGVSWTRGGRLRFDHPVPDLFNLTVTAATPEDSGVYHCEVEEWLISPPGRRKVGVAMRSEEITVDVRSYLPVGHVSDSRSATLLGVLTGLVLILLVVVLLLVLKIRRGQHPGAKKGDTLWTEGQPLQYKLDMTKGE